MGSFLSSLGSPSGPEASLVQQAEDHRRKADELALKQRETSARSQAAYKAGNGELAKKLSVQAKELHKEVEHHNKEAARLYYLHHNQDSSEGTIDLHGLFVKEAIAKLDGAVKEAIKKKQDKLTVIVGAGNHSEGGVQRIRPGVEKWLRERGHTWEVVNQGCLLVQLRPKSFCCIIM